MVIFVFILAYVVLGLFILLMIDYSKIRKFGKKSIIISWKLYNYEEHRFKSITKFDNFIKNNFKNSSKIKKRTHIVFKDDIEVFHLNKMTNLYGRARRIKLFKYFLQEIYVIEISVNAMRQSTIDDMFKLLAHEFNHNYLYATTGDSDPNHLSESWERMNI